VVLGKWVKEGGRGCVLSNDEMFRAKLSHSLDAGVEATMRTDTMSKVPRYSCGKGLERVLGLEGHIFRHAVSVGVRELVFADVEAY
jgi:hypothetical protein